jgi:hypothetical protein
MDIQFKYLSELYDEAYFIVVIHNTSGAPDTDGFLSYVSEFQKSLRPYNGVAVPSNKNIETCHERKVLHYTWTNTPFLDEASYQAAYYNALAVESDRLDNSQEVIDIVLLFERGKDAVYTQEMLDRLRSNFFNGWTGTRDKGAIHGKVDACWKYATNWGYLMPCPTLCFLAEDAPQQSENTRYWKVPDGWDKEPQPVCALISYINERLRTDGHNWQWSTEKRSEFMKSAVCIRIGSNISYYDSREVRRFARFIAGHGGSNPILIYGPHGPQSGGTYISFNDNDALYRCLDPFSSDCEEDSL